METKFRIHKVQSGQFDIDLSFEQPRQFNIDSGLSREFRGVSGDACRPREPYGENAENCREDRNNSGRGRRYFVSVVMNEMASINEDRARNGGAIFFYGLIFFLVFATWFWWLTGRRGQ